MVGLPEHLDEARAMRAALSAEVYLWVNAAEGRRYDAAEEALGLRDVFAGGLLERIPAAWPQSGVPG